MKTYINKQTGDKVKAIQWFGRNLRVIFKEMGMTVSDVVILKFEKRDFFWLKSKDGMRKVKVHKGDWIFHDDKNINSFNTELFNRIFDKQ